MFSFLKSPYPCVIGQKENLITAFLIGLFVALFLIIFQPFGIQESKEDYRVLKSAGFGVVAFLVLVFFYFVIPKIFSNFYQEKTYTVGKDIISSIALILLISIANGFYAHFALAQPAFDSMFMMISQTFLVGIFPLTVLSLLQYNRLLRSNLKASQDIKLPEETKVSAMENQEEQYYLISGEQENTKIVLTDLLYLESDGNYANLNQYKEGTHLKTLHRATLKSIESENTYANIIRCHRSYIVNLDQVIHVNGNAQGLKLSLKNCEEVVPVSRKYISTVKNYFNQN